MPGDSTASCGCLLFFCRFLGEYLGVFVFGVSESPSSPDSGEERPASKRACARLLSSASALGFWAAAEFPTAVVGESMLRKAGVLDQYP